eukprot:619822-Rhodomonas_salina.2
MDSVQRGQKRVTGGMRRGSQVDWEIVPTLLTPQPSTENVAPGERLGARLSAEECMRHPYFTSVIDPESVASEQDFDFVSR